MWIVDGRDVVDELARIRGVEFACGVDQQRRGIQTLIADADGAGAKGCGRWGRQCYRHSRTPSVEGSY
jgi:hypothetical protein